jgi:hypothetical protein
VVTVGGSEVGVIVGEGVAVGVFVGVWGFVCVLKVVELLGDDVGVRVGVGAGWVAGSSVSILGSYVMARRASAVVSVLVCALVTLLDV